MTREVLLFGSTRSATGRANTADNNSIQQTLSIPVLNHLALPRGKDNRRTRLNLLEKPVKAKKTDEWVGWIGDGITSTKKIRNI